MKETLIFTGGLIILGILMFIFMYRISTGTDKHTLRHKSKVLDYVNKYILDSDEQGEVVRHFITSRADHEIVIYNPSGYINLSLINIGGDKKYLYSITKLKEGKI